jgi:hypothetical protein
LTICLLILVASLQSAWAQAPVGSATADVASARAYLLRAIAIEDPKARRADALASIAALGESALASQPMTLAAALGVAARRTDPIESVRQRFASRSKAAISAALRSSPNEPWASLMEGLWHLEALRRGGAIASQMLGASEEVGVGGLERARRGGAGDAAILFAVCVAYASYDAERFREAALAVLEAAQAGLQESSELERAVLAPRIVALRQALTELSDDAVEALAAEMI